MSWDHLQECKLGTALVRVKKIRVEHQRNLVPFRYPGREGTEHEDTGSLGRKFMADIVFLDTADQDYDEAFRAVRAVLEQAGRVTFVHPHHGSATVRVKRLTETTSHEGSRYIEAQLDLVEDVTEESGFVAGDAGVDGAALDFDTAAATATAALAALA